MRNRNALLAFVVLSALGAACPWACARQPGSTSSESSDSGAFGDALDASDGGERWTALFDDASDAGDLGDRPDAPNGDSENTSNTTDPDSGDGPGQAVMVPTLHRATASSCTQPRPGGKSCSTTPCDLFGDFVEAGCATDQDCTGRSNGRFNCQQIGVTMSQASTCSYDQCASDNDCSGRVCLCRENPIYNHNGYCLPTNNTCFASGNCRVDSDCGDGGYCSPSPAPGCGASSWYGYFCHTAADQCVNDSDCNQGNSYCAYGGAGHWACSTGLCPDG